MFNNCMQAACWEDIRFSNFVMFFTTGVNCLCLNNCKYLDSQLRCSNNSSIQNILFWPFLLNFTALRILQGSVHIQRFVTSTVLVYMQTASTRTGLYNVYLPKRKNTRTLKLYVIFSCGKLYAFDANPNTDFQLTNFCAWRCVLCIP